VLTYTADPSAVLQGERRDEVKNAQKFLNKNDDFIFRAVFRVFSGQS
jgi:hypothetical protein